MSNLYRVDDLALEAFVDIRNDQPPRDRLHYFDVVLESSESTRGTLIQKLYVDIISKSNIDFGKIPDSKGDLTKYEYYKEISESIGALNQLTDSTKSEDLDSLNKLYDMIITLRSDYEFGYKFDVEFIKLSYNIAVMSLFEMINVCIMEYANYLRDVKDVDFGFKKTKKKDLIIIRGVKSILKSYSNGEWQKMMSQFKKNPKNAFGMSDVLKYANKIPGVDASRVIGFGNKAAGTTPGDIDVNVSNGAVAVIAVIGIILLLIAIRFLVYFFYNRAAKIENYVETQKEFLEVAIAKDSSGNGKAIDQQKNMADKLGRIAAFIETKIFKTETSAEKALSQSNKENFNKTDFTGSGINNSEISLF